MNHVKYYKSNGFTLVELSLSMGFVATLLIAIVMTVIQIGNIYNKGITLKEVDQIGRLLSNDIISTVSQSASFNIDPSVSNNKFIDQTNGGRLCTSHYSYIWNYGNKINTSPLANLNKYSGNSKIIRFVKVFDNIGNYCKPDPTTGLYPDIDFTKSTELLESGNIDFAIHKFSIDAIQTDNKTKQTLYKINFLLGTNDIASINTTYDKCKAPNETGSSERDSTYCALNYFQLLVRSGNIY